MWVRVTHHFVRFGMTARNGLISCNDVSCLDSSGQGEINRVHQYTIDIYYIDPEMMENSFDIDDT